MMFTYSDMVIAESIIGIICFVTGWYFHKYLGKPKDVSQRALR